MFLTRCSTCQARRCSLETRRPPVMVSALILSNCSNNFSNQKSSGRKGKNNVPCVGSTDPVMRVGQLYISYLASLALVLEFKVYPSSRKHPDNGQRGYS